MRLPKFWVQTHIPTYTPTPVKNRENIHNTPIFLCQKCTGTSNKCPAWTSWTPPPSSPDANKQTAHARAHAHTTWRVCSEIYTLVSTPSDLCSLVTTGKTLDGLLERPSFFLPLFLGWRNPSLITQAGV